LGLQVFDHYTIRAADVLASSRFYQDVMGLRAEALDAFEFPMALMFLGSQAIVHLLQAGAALDTFLDRHAPAYSDGQARGTGNLEHVAFNATGLNDFLARLDQSGVPVVRRSLPGYGVHQLLFKDPDGIEIEVNFPLVEMLG